MTTCALPLLRRSLLVLSIASALSLALVLGTTREALAASASGSQVQGYNANKILTVTCPEAACTTSVTMTIDASDSMIPDGKIRWSRSSTDPRTTYLAGGGTADVLISGKPSAPESTAPVSYTQYGATWAAQSVGSGRYLWVFIDYAATGRSYLMGTWDLEFGTAPPTTAAPTTSPPTSSPSTSAPSTSSGTSGPSDPTTPPDGSGGISCPESAPCFVHQVNPVPVDVGSIEVSALTEDQWSELYLALGALVFFSAGSFVSSWRHGRTR